MSAALFAIEQPPTPTPGQRRRARQAVAIAHGQHPLAVALRVSIPLHADAAPVDDRTAPGLRCGTCAHRQQLGGHARSYAKCTAGGDPNGRGRRYPRRTNGIGTDVLASWPACTDHQTA